MLITTKDTSTVPGAVMPGHNRKGSTMTRDEFPTVVLRLRMVCFPRGSAHDRWRKLLGTVWAPWGEFSAGTAHHCGTGEAAV
jgi:hypothetical protein